MMEMDSVIGGWRNGGVHLNGPASDRDLSRLAEFLGALVPNDLRALYSAADGMDDYGTDQWHVSFWSIDRIIRERDMTKRAGHRWVAFADFLVYSWCFRMLPNNDRTTVLHDGTGEVFQSMGQFFDRYALDPESLALVKDG